MNRQSLLSSRVMPTEPPSPSLSCIHLKKRSFFGTVDANLITMLLACLNYLVIIVSLYYDRLPSILAIMFKIYSLDRLFPFVLKSSP